MAADIILILCLLLCLFIGYRVGTIKVVAGIGSFVIGYYAARSFSAAFAAMATQAMPAIAPGRGTTELSFLFPLFIDTNTFANRFLQMIAFIIIFIVISYIIRKLAHLLDGVFRGTILGAVNGALGAACALVVFVLLFNIFFNFVVPVFDNNAKIGAVRDFIIQSKIVLPYLGDFEHLLQNNINLI